MSCRDCRFLKVFPDRDGKRRVRAREGYVCCAPIPDPLGLPDSITTSAFFHWFTSRDAAWMRADQGSECPAFVAGVWSSDGPTEALPISTETEPTKEPK